MVYSTTSEYYYSPVIFEILGRESLKDPMSMTHIIMLPTLQ